jgi:hypothetical protein
VFWHGEGADVISISAGTLNPPTRLKPGRHAFLSDAGDYYDAAMFAERAAT